jgi:hypothetical protein
MNNFKYFIKIDLENLCGNPLYHNGYYDYDFPVDFKRHFLEFDNRNDFIINYFVPSFYKRVYENFRKTL